MNDAPRRTLRELIAARGPGLCSDARRCEGLLRDLCGEHRREINVLVGALRERVPLDLLAARNSVPRGLLLARLAKRLEEHLALTEEASRWAVDSWALALDIVSEAELKESRSLREEADVPRVEVTTRQTPPPVAAEPQASKRAAPSSTPPPPPTRARPSLPPLPAQTPRASPPARATHASPGVSSAATTRSPPIDATPRGGRGRWRGCMVGCLLVILLSVLLGLGVPFVINLLREEQQQRNLEPPPVQTR
jgi:hypothetical protein